MNAQATTTRTALIAQVQAAIPTFEIEAGTRSLTASEKVELYGENSQIIGVTANGRAIEFVSAHSRKPYEIDCNGGCTCKASGLCWHQGWFRKEYGDGVYGTMTMQQVMRNAFLMITGFAPKTSINEADF